MNQIHIHFDGDFAQEHRVSMRTLGKTLSHLQSAIDRAYLDLHYGKVWKNARMTKEDYAQALFLVPAPENGGYILDFLAETPVTKNIIKRLQEALSPAVHEAHNLAEDTANRILKCRSSDLI